MGNRIVSMIIRPIRNFDAERRAHKVISKEKPTVAPQYEAAKKQLLMAQDLDPKFMEKHNKKDTKLDKNLKDVFVIADDPVPDLSNRTDPTKPLPRSRKSHEYEDMNLYEIENLIEGKCSVQQVQTFLTNYMNDSQKHNATNIAEQYKLDKKVVENILEHYKVFRVITRSDIQKMTDEEEKRKKLEPGFPPKPPIS